jgi:hypothetical protein
LTAGELDGPATGDGFTAGRRDGPATGKHDRPAPTGGERRNTTFDGVRGTVLMTDGAGPIADLAMLASMADAGYAPPTTVDGRG